MDSDPQVIIVLIFFALFAFWFPAVPEFPSLQLWVINNHHHCRNNYNHALHNRLTTFFQKIRYTVSTLYTLCHLFLIATLWSRHYYTYTYRAHTEQLNLMG